jgi:aminoglycoside 3-N-acetyltransferase
MKNLFADVNLKTGDTVMVSSDVLKIMIHNKKSKNKIDIDSIIDMIIEKISHKGTLLFPTFNWDFCSGKDFDYKKNIKSMWNSFEYSFEKIRF